jgi:hypothetical protein
MARRSPDWLYQFPDWPRFQKALLRLKAKCAAQRACLVVAVIPEPAFLYAPLVVEQLPPTPIRDAAVRNVDAHSQLLAPFCEAHDIPFIDTTAALRTAAAQGVQLCFPIDPHWNADGHRIIAREIHRVLRQKHLLSLE